MTFEDNVRAILHCNFAETKDEIIEVAVRCICNLKPQGEWIEDYQPDENPFFQKGWRCSACGIRTSYGRPEYCMRCGAKMIKREPQIVNRGNDNV